jgi:hypothetical protein
MEESSGGLPTLQGVGQILLPGGRLSFLTIRVPPSRQIEPAADPSAANYKSSASDPARPVTDYSTLGPDHHVKTSLIVGGAGYGVLAGVHL